MIDAMRWRGDSQRSIWWWVSGLVFLFAVVAVLVVAGFCRWGLDRAEKLVSVGSMVTGVAALLVSAAACFDKRQRPEQWWAVERLQLSVTWPVPRWRRPGARAWTLNSDPAQAMGSPFGSGLSRIGLVTELA
jgi:hypothetical protein